jgi:hypothetical protein
MSDAATGAPSMREAPNQLSMQLEYGRRNEAGAGRCLSWHAAGVWPCVLRHGLQFTGVLLFLVPIPLLQNVQNGSD